MNPAICSKTIDVQNSVFPSETYERDSELNVDQHSYFDLDSSEISLLPFLVWSDPITRRHQNRVFAVLERLATQYPNCIDAASLAPSIRSAFARPILALSYRTLMVELGIARYTQRLSASTPEARFQEFIHQLDDRICREQIDRDYPCLRENVIRQTRQTARALITMLRRVVCDHERLCALTDSNCGPGMLLHFKTELGDRHANGKSVAKLWFKNALLYYKPRSMAIDIAFAEFISWLRERCVGPDQRTSMTLDCGQYGYACEIAHCDARSEQEVRDYYGRFGGLVAIAYLLGATDLHCENLIAAGAYPIIIDMETMLQPCHVGRNSRSARRFNFYGTVIYSSLLPRGEADKKPEDASALFMPLESQFVRVPTNSGTDLFRLQEQRVELPFSANMARLSGQCVEPHRYAESICEGFQRTYCALLELKQELLDENGPLAHFKALRVRVLVRSTKSYGYFQNALSHPDYLRSMKQRDTLTEHLKPGDGSLKLLHKTWSVEKMALLRGDIPYFHAKIDSRWLCDEFGNSLGMLYGSSAWDELQRHIRALSPRDLARQKRILQEAVISTRPVEQLSRWTGVEKSMPAAKLANRFCVNAFVEQARNIGDRILEGSFDDGVYVRYYQLQQVKRDAFRPVQLGVGLYEGLAGLGLFFGELYMQTGVKRFLRACERILSSLRAEYSHPQRYSESIGAYSGMTGWIYTLAALGMKLDRKEYISESLRWLPWIEKRVSGDQNFDVMDGAAGVLLVLTELDRVAPNQGVLTVARQCAQHLSAMATHDERGVYWKCAHAPHAGLTGFSHGASGIAAALGRFGAHTGDIQYVELAREAMRYERSTYDTEKDGWPDLRMENPLSQTSANFMFSWCHGAPGIGLARLAMPFELRDGDWKLDLERCLRLTLQHGFRGSHCICHGKLGNLELLLHYVKQFPESLPREVIKDISNSILCEGIHQWRAESYTGLDILGFMNGLAGIGYGLLRIANSSHTASVALLELTPQN